MVNWLKLEISIGNIEKGIGEIKESLDSLKELKTPKVAKVKIDYDTLAEKIVDRLKSQEVP